MRLIPLSILSVCTLAFGSWPGTLGKICFDTPKPASISGQDLKEKCDGKLKPGQTLEECSAEAEKMAPTRYGGDLFAIIDASPSIPLPRDRGVLVSGLEVNQKHKIEIVNGSGKKQDAFTVQFDNPKDPRIRISQGGFYHVGMQVMPPPRSCPWPLAK